MGEGYCKCPLRRFLVFQPANNKKKREERGENGGKEGEKRRETRVKGGLRYPKLLAQQTEVGKVVGIQVYFELVLC